MPDALWYGTFKELRASALEIPDKMREHAIKMGLKPSEQEYNSWVASLKFLSKDYQKTDYNTNALENLIVLLEVLMPSGNERADCVIFGGRKHGVDKPICGMILEMKEWSHCKVNNDSEFVDIGIKNVTFRRHPLLQAWNYRGKLANFLGVSSRIEWDYLALLPNLSDDDLQKLRNNPLIPRADAFKIQGKDSFAACFASIRQKNYLERKLAIDKIDSFLESSFSYPEGLFTFAKKNIGKFRESALFLEGGFGLTDEQQLLCEQVLEALSNNKPTHFVIEGSPGSGKTMVAMMLLAQALAQGKKAVLALLGQQLSNIQKNILRKLYRDGGGELVYSIHGGQYKDSEDIISLANGRLKGHFDLVICDEAQRMREVDIPTIIETATVTVMLLDEKQQLAPFEKGTVKNFQNNIDKSQFKYLRLPSAMRCRGGQPYLDWVNQLLKTKSSKVNLSTQSWDSKYAFKIFDSFDEMHFALQKKRESGNTVALIASFTESSGKKEKTKDGTIRIGPKLASGASLYNKDQQIVRWVMGNEPYERFWLENESNKLTTAAAVYGVQGFEREYIGLVWGRDYIYNNGFKAGNPESCFDSRLIKKDDKNHHNWKYNNATTEYQLFNRYWILLTRGVMGTYIYCEDVETANYLKKLCF